MFLAPLSLIDPEEWRSKPPITLPPSDYPLHLELNWEGGSSYWRKVLAGSVAFHLLVLAVAMRLPHFQAMTEPTPGLVVHKVPLYLPRDVLTQKAPNKHAVTRQVDLADLMELQTQQARQASPDRSVKQFEMPKSSPPKQGVKAPISILPDVPVVATNQTSPLPTPGANNGLAAAPPPLPASTSPFQNMGSEAVAPARPRTAPPKAIVQDAAKGLNQRGSGSQVIISDDSLGQDTPPSPGIAGQPGAQHAGVELKSDPQGVDMRPYLAQILSIVRANWRRVIPLSVRMGTMRGKTVVEFIINRDGSIPKLVTSESSGLDPLDRAAVTGLSMSNPLPPLPTDFKGDQVRLAFSFTYNMATP